MLKFLEIRIGEVIIIWDFGILVMKEEERSTKIIYILIGPKGSGKTFIGTVLNKHFGILFLRVEDLALRVKGERKFNDSDYVWEVFGAIEREVRNNLEIDNELIFESTGLTEAFDLMLANLKRDFNVVVIRIKTDLDKCLERVKMRDDSIQINVSDENVNAINSLAVKKAFEFDGEMDNNKAGVDEIIAEFEKIKLKLAI